jgi:hypothetical protein
MTVSSFLDLQGASAEWFIGDRRCVLVLNATRGDDGRPEATQWRRRPHFSRNSSPKPAWFWEQHPGGPLDSL